MALNLIDYNALLDVVQEAKPRDFNHGKLLTILEAKLQATIQGVLSPALMTPPPIPDKQDDT